jgi:hypothetical protein
MDESAGKGRVAGIHDPFMFKKVGKKAYAPARSVRYSLKLLNA